jgi:hypothetical protein
MLIPPPVYGSQQELSRNSAGTQQELSRNVTHKKVFVLCAAPPTGLVHSVTHMTHRKRVVVLQESSKTMKRLWG